MPRLWQCMCSKRKVNSFCEKDLIQHQIEKAFREKDLVGDQKENVSEQKDFIPGQQENSFC